MPLTARLSRRPALAAALLCVAVACTRTEIAEPMPQGWSAELRERYYHTSQGGRIMPAAYFLALENGDGLPFASQEALAHYGFLPAGPDLLGLNPHGLPVGFAMDGEGPEAGVGLNCAACHTSEVVAGGRRLRIDGAPAALDFDRFVADLAEAVADVADPAGEARAAFAAKVRERAPALAEPEAITRFAEAFAAEAAVRAPAHPSGPGRVDALTQIVNALAVTDLGVPENHVAPAAPTSYPALWLAPRLEFVQWNAIASDPLGRNLGQALGVFGRTELRGEPRFASSARLDALLAYENWLRMLEPPRWPEKLLGPIDMELGAKGRDLFAANCESCHNAPPFRETPPEANLRGERFVEIRAVPSALAGTDPVYLRTLLGRRVAKGPLDGTLTGDGDRMPGVLFFGEVVRHATARALADAGLPPTEALRLRPPTHPDCAGIGRPCGYAAPAAGAGMKAGPLIGVWATGPYLHNGSVRTVYELLSPPEERAAAFWIGDRRIDADRLGFAGEKVPGAFRFDTSLPGNGNGGHVFWDRPFTQGEKTALIEYLKDPERFPMAR